VKELGGYISMPDSDTSVDDLKSYTNDQLMEIIYQRLAPSQDARLRELVALGKQGKLTIDEKSELERLIDLVYQQMLLRSEALLLLKSRG
jgi:hypothetical protein